MRWFDGVAWTKQTQPAGASPPPKPSRMGRNVVLGTLGLIVTVIVVIAVASNNKKTDNTPAAQGSTSASGVSQGLGANDATGDVVIGKLVTQADTDISEAPVTITNHSSKRSDYFVTVALESSNRKTQIDTSPVFVQNLEPGQSSVQTADFITTLTTPAPAGAQVVLQSVQRTSSN
jgi:hypothetical protein